MLVSEYAGADYLLVDKSLMGTQMNSGLTYAKEEKMPVTKMADLLINARDSVFTLTFNTKLDSKVVKEKLAAADSSSFNDMQKARALAKELLEGKEVTLTAKCRKYEPKLGRSLVIDLNSPVNKGYRWVDHRTLKSIIFQGVKYTVN